MPDAPSQPQGAAAILKAEEEKRRQKHRETVLRFKRCFATEDGRFVLEYLEKNYSFDADDYTPGATAMDLAYRSGTKSPIRCCRKLRDTVLPALGREPRRMRARS